MSEIPAPITTHRSDDGPGRAAGDGLVRPRSLRADRAALRGGAAGLTGYLAAICDRIDTLNPRIHAFLPDAHRRERVLAAAAATPHASWRGVPVGVKDIIQVDGLPTRAGSALPPTELAAPQASVVTRLLAAGAVVAGKTVTAEFAVAAPGPTVNPHNPRHTPGGSSSGSAAAVASGMVPLALGTQTVGSVVRPAAYCGVVGFKASHGRIPTDGVIPNAPSLDCLGWFTAGVADAAEAGELICPGWRPVPALDRPPVVGVPAPQFLASASAVARRAFARQLDALAAAGCEVRHTTFLTDFDKVRRWLRLVNRAELARAHAGWFARHGERYRPQTAAAIIEGQQIPGDDYRAGLRRQRRFTDEYTRRMADDGVDVWLAPAATGPAPAGLDSTGDPVMGVPASFAGAPVVSIPAGTDPTGLPLAIQCAGVPGQDERTLAVGLAIEAALAGR